VVVVLVVWPHRNDAASADSSTVWRIDRFIKGMLLVELLAWPSGTARVLAARVDGVWLAGVYIVGRPTNKLSGQMGR
jgi:hypothetical protein